MTQKDFNFLKITFSESFGGSHKRCSIKKAILKNFAIFTGNICAGVCF